MKTLKNPIKEGSNVYYSYGYPVIMHPKDHASNDIDEFLQTNPHVAAQATGQVDGEENEGRAVVLNAYHPQYTSDPNSERNKSLIKLEASRHVMHENNFEPKFQITPEMQSLREKNFSYSEAGKYYLNDDNAFKQTVISRLVSGDTSFGGDDEIPVTPDLQEEVDSVSELMNKREEKYGDQPINDTGNGETSFDNFPSNENDIDVLNSVLRKAVSLELKNKLIELIKVEVKKSINKRLVSLRKK